MITHLLLTIIIDETLDVVALFENLAFVGGFVLILHGTVLILYVNRLKVGKIIENLEMHFPHHILDQYNFDTNKHLQLLKKHSFAIFYSMGSMVIVFCLMPIFVQIYGRVTGNEQSLSTIVHLSFPFDQMQHGLYEIVYFYQAFITIIGVSLLVMNDMLFCSIVELTAMEFDIIADVLSEINVEDEAEKELKGLIDIHQQLLEVVKKINEIFSPLMLINVLGVTTIACFSAFFCVTGISMYLFIKYLIPVPAVLIHFYLYCYFAERLKQASSRVTQGAYNSLWYEGSIKYRKMILVIILRAQNGEKLIAWKFGDINLETFLNVLNKSYTFLTVLKVMYES